MGKSYRDGDRNSDGVRAMRLAGMLLGIALIIVAAAQVLLVVGVATFSDSFGREAWSGGLFLFAVLIGITFAYGVPLAGASAYAIAAVIGVIGAAISEFDDLYIWGGLALLTSAVAFGGAYEQGKEQARRRSRDDLAVALLNELRTLRLLLTDRERPGPDRPERDEKPQIGAPQRRPEVDPAAAATRADSSPISVWSTVTSSQASDTRLVGGAFAAAPSQPVLSLVPDRALAGELVTVIGYGFRPGCQIYIAWAGIEGSARIIAQQMTDPSGVARFSFSCPHVPAGIYRVVVGAPGEAQAGAVLTVLPASTDGATESAIPTGIQVRA